MLGAISLSIANHLPAMLASYVVRPVKFRLKRYQLLGHRFYLRIGECKSIFDVDVAALCPSKLFEPLQECRETRLVFGVVLRRAHEHADVPHPVSFLRLRRKRPRRRAAEQRNELAALYSMQIHLLPQLGDRQHTALASIKSGPRCTARF